MDINKEIPLGVDATTEEDYAYMSNLLQEFTSIPNIDKAWLSKSDSSKHPLFSCFFPLCVSFVCYDIVPLLTLFYFFSIATGLQGMFSISQPDLLANKSKRFILSCHILKESNSSVKFLWSPFPIEISGVSLIVLSPSGSKLLVI